FRFGTGCGLPLDRLLEGVFQFLKSPKPEGLTRPADGGRRDVQGFGQFVHLAVNHPFRVFKNIVQHPLFQGAQVLSYRLPSLQQMSHPSALPYPSRMVLYSIPRKKQAADGHPVSSTRWKPMRFDWTTPMPPPLPSGGVAGQPPRSRCNWSTARFIRFRPWITLERAQPTFMRKKESALGP